MTRSTGVRRLAGLIGLGAAAVLALGALPAQATLVCPPGTTNPKYCVNVVPIASTSKASNLNGPNAQLNGVSGPGVNNGDVTNYHFDWGLTTKYGATTPTGTVGSCPPGKTNGPYCTVPAAEDVSSTIGGLTACTVYHYRIVSTNPDGTTVGNDSSFTSAFQNPLHRIKVKRRVRRHHHFNVQVFMNFPADVTIALFKGHHRLKFFDEGTVTSQVTQSIRAPRRRGDYNVAVRGNLSCGSQLIRRPVHVH